MTPFIQPEVYKDGGICKCSRSCHVFHKQQQILEAGSCLSLTAACQDQWSVSPTGVLYSVFRFFHGFFNYWVHMQGCSHVWYPKQSGPFNWKMLPEQGKNPSCSVFGDNFLFIHHNWKFYLVHLLTKPVLVSGLLLPWGSCLTLLFPCVSFAVLGSVGQPFQGAYLEISENPKYKKLKDAVDEKIIIAEVVNKINRANGKVITWIYLIYPAG